MAPTPPVTSDLGAPTPMTLADGSGAVGSAAVVEPALVDGVNVDAVAAAILRCPGVSGLSGGRFGEVGTYLPGRRVAGVQLTGDTVTVHVRGVWGVPVARLYEQVSAAVAALVARRTMHLVLADIDDPPVPVPVPAPGVSTLDASLSLGQPRPVQPPPGG